MGVAPRQKPKSPRAFGQENLLEMDQRCQEALKAEWEKMMAKKAKAQLQLQTGVEDHIIQ